MAAAIRRHLSTLNARPVESPPFTSPFAFRPVSGFLGNCKDATQGACAGLLGLLGAIHMTEAPTLLTSHDGAWGSMGTLLERMAHGGLAGPVELLGAIVLFLARSENRGENVWTDCFHRFHYRIRKWL